MSTRPRLLFLAQTLPYPPDGGVNIRTFNILRLLSERYEIDLVCFYRKRVARDVPSSLTALKGFVRSVEAFPIPQEHSRIRFLRDHLASTIGASVYTRHAYESKAVRRTLASMVRNRKPHLIHVDSLDLSAYLEDLAISPIVVVHHNVESELLRRRASQTRGWIESGYIRFQAGLMQKEERTFTPHVALNVVCSSTDASRLKEIAGEANIEVVPNGVDVHHFSPNSGVEPRGIVSVGGMTWFPNRDAAEYFGTEILPLVRSKLPAIETTWVGRATPGEIAALGRNGVTMTGYVEDVRPYLSRGACFVCPIRIGGGTRLKLLDAWAMGKAIVSTTIGAEGLEAIDGENMLLRDEPHGIADAVLCILKDRDLRIRLERGAREMAVSRYSWHSIGLKMLDAYAKVEASV